MSTSMAVEFTLEAMEIILDGMGDNAAGYLNKFPGVAWQLPKEMQERYGYDHEENLRRARRRRAHRGDGARRRRGATK